MQKKSLLTKKMLRDLIAWVLNNYLGKYVGNLNTAQLTVALLSGKEEEETRNLQPPNTNIAIIAKI